MEPICVTETSGTLETNASSLAEYMVNVFEAKWSNSAETIV